MYIVSSKGDLVGQKYAGSKYITGIHSFPHGQNESMNSEIRKSFYFGNGEYYKVLYDGFRNVYYRFALHPTPVSKDARVLKRCSIIILNNNLTPIGEYFLPDSYAYYMSYVTKDGLQILRKTDDENNLEFTTFEIVPASKI